jgi:uncharacterized delta-60 repeat protein
MQDAYYKVSTDDAFASYTLLRVDPSDGAAWVDPDTEEVSLEQTVDTELDPECAVSVGVKLIVESGKLTALPTIEWNFDGWGDLSDVASREYDPDGLNGGSVFDDNDYISNNEAVLHDIVNDTYYKVDIAAWSGGSYYHSWGGVSYTRALIGFDENDQVTLGERFIVEIPDGRVLDELSEGVQLMRGWGGSLYASQSVEWNVQGWDDLTNVADRAYTTSMRALFSSGGVGNEVEDAQLVMRDRVNDTYYKVDFSSWTSGGGGGFAYERRQINANGSLGDPVLFTHEDYSDTVDVIAPGVIVTRGLSKPLDSSPIRWNADGWDNLGDFSSRSFHASMESALGETNGVGSEFEGTEWVMQDLSTGKYYKVDVTHWQQRGGGGVAYERSEIVFNDGVNEGSDIAIINEMPLSSESGDFAINPITGEVTYVGDLSSWDGRSDLSFNLAVQDVAGNRTVKKINLEFVLPPVINVTVSPAEVAEGDPANLVYTFTRSGNAGGELTVNIEIAGTATAEDFTTGLPSLRSWTRLLGSSQVDHAYSVSAAADGSVFVAGLAESTLDGQSFSGGYDAFVTQYNASGEKQWTQLFGGTNSDKARSVAPSADGSVYVVGETYSSLFEDQDNSGNYDAFVTRFNANGVKQGTQLLGGSGQDFAYSVAVDTSGSVYVVGDTHSTDFDNQASLGGSDAFVTKFDADGVKQLTLLWGGSGNDSAYAVTTDADGSVYVAGGTTGSFDGQTNLGGSDAFLTKFNEAGVQQWTRFAGGSGSDTARSVALGTDGSVYVAGVTTGSFDGQTHQGNDDAFVTKFNASGVRQWTRLLGGSGYDEAYSVAVSADDSVYVAGRSDGSFGGQTNLGGSDAFLAKFDASGSWQGTQFFGGTGDDWAFSAAIAPGGVVYMAGAAGGSIDGQNHQGGYWDSFLTKYSPPILSEITFAAGSTTATLELKASADDLLEGNEEVIVTVASGDGYSVDPAASSATGIIKDPPVIEVELSTASVTEGEDLVYTFTRVGDTSGALTVNIDYAGTASANADFGIDGPFGKSWSRLVGGSSSDNLSSIAIKADGGFYAVGQASYYSDNNPLISADGAVLQPLGDSDGYIRKFASDGTEEWTRLYGGSTADNVTSVTVGADGSAYVTGYYYDSGYYKKFITKFTSAGIQDWTFGSDVLPQGTSKASMALAPDDESTLILGGSYYAGNGDSTFLTTMTLDDSGPPDTLSTVYLTQRTTQAIAAAGNGVVYLTGYTEHAIEGQSYASGGDAFLSKLNGDGTVAWSRLIGGSGWDSGTSVVAGSDGGVYVAGFLDTSYFVNKYDANGASVWSTTIANGSNYASSLAIGSDGFVYLSGITTQAIDGQSSLGGNDAFVTRIDPESGQSTFTHIVGSDGDDRATAITAGPTGAILIGGTAYKSYDIVYDGLESLGSSDGFVTQFAPLPPPTTVTFAAGSATATLTLKTKADDLTESNEGVTVTVALGNGYSVDPAASSATGIIKDPPVIEVGLSTASVTEGEDLVYTFTRVGDTSGALTVNIETAGTATAADYPTTLSKKWSQMVGGEGPDELFSIASTPDGGFYVLGAVSGYSSYPPITSADGTDLDHFGSYDVFMRKYDALGVEEWTRIYGGTGEEYSYSMAVDSAGASYIAGYGMGTSTELGANTTFVVKYSSEGDLAAELTNLAPAGYGGRSVILTPDESALLILAGGLGGNGPETYITKVPIESDGFGSSASFAHYTDRVATAMATTSDGLVYLTGYCEEPRENALFDEQTHSGRNDAFITQFSETGERLWTRLIGDANEELGFSVVVGPDGAVYVAGAKNVDVQGSPRVSTIFVNKFDADGTPGWSQSIENGVGASIGNFQAALAIGSDGFVYLSGITTEDLDGQQVSGGDSLGAGDAFISRINPSNGAVTHTQIVANAGDERTWAIAARPNDEILIGGYSGGSFDWDTYISTYGYDGLPGLGQSDGFITSFSTPSLYSKVTFAPGSDTATLRLKTIVDSETDIDETAIVTLLEGQGYKVGTASSTTGTIEDKSVIDLGSLGQLIAPVQVEGKWYYHLDRNGDGTIAGDAYTMSDANTYPLSEIYDLFKQDVNDVSGSSTNDTYRYATVNGVKLALPTLGTSPNEGLMFGTALNNATQTNPSYDDLSAIWDAYNGTLVGSYAGQDLNSTNRGSGNITSGAPSTWVNDSYVSATPWPAGNEYAALRVYDGLVFNHANWAMNVALQVL